MGWSNYIIIEDWKMIIETNREVDNLEDYIKESLDKMINNEEENVDISNLKVSDITIKDLCTLASAYDNASSLAFIAVDKLFLFWLEGKGIKYEIKQEHGFDFKKYEEGGYKFIRKWNYGNDDEYSGNKSEKL